MGAQIPRHSGRRTPLIPINVSLFHPTENKDADPTEFVPCPFLSPYGILSTRIVEKKGTMRMNEKQRQEVANFRYGLIAPIVTRKLNPGEQAALLKEIASHSYDIPHSQAKRVSLRTLERYLKDYREGGWEALLPSVRADKLTCKQIPPDVLEKAIALKQEQPLRSVRQIMAILELSQFVEPGTIRESTLSKQLRRRGMTRKKLAQASNDTFRRFEADHRNACWQGDVQHTLYLPHPEQEGKKKMAYLVVFLDDYSRYVVHGQFYFEERVPRLEDCFKKAILKH
jgi:putative transposase